jgi:membrane protease YdiL (CAAX protease family)
MGRYFGDIIWPTILIIAIVIPVFITYMPYISSGGYDIASSITQTLVSSLGNPLSLVSTYLLSDLAPYLYVVIVALIIVHRGRLRGLGKELGFSWKPTLGLITIPAVIALAVVWFLISGLLPLSVIPGISLPNALTLIYTLYPIAISEEVVFRGFILNRLLPKDWDYSKIPIINTIPAIIVSAVYFTLAHIPVYLAVYGINNLISLLSILTYILIYGIISGLIYVITGNIIPDIIIHWINDYLSIEFMIRSMTLLGTYIMIPSIF